tara:strand:- start:6415 stop:6714 length:300 start_codon:yes stop_codon:yes gene_type:complete
MKGKSRTKADIEFQNKIASIGCIVCLNQGIENHHISIHHIDGRTKAGAHRKVLPLCYRHHQLQDNDKPKHWQTLHANKAEFEREYGTQHKLLEQCMGII